MVRPRAAARADAHACRPLYCCRHAAQYLICNGASPLIVDHYRHNTCLHWSAAHCRSDCITKLLTSRASFALQVGAPARGVGAPRRRAPLTLRAFPEIQASCRVYGPPV
jgi:hypothetical protein